MITIHTNSDDVSCRLDRVIRKRFPLRSLSELYALIRKGGVLVNDKRVKQNYRLQEGDTLKIDLDPSELVPDKKVDASVADLVNTAFFKRNFRIIYEDNDLLACNKPAGLVVHPGTGHLKHDTLIELAVSYLQSKGEEPQNEPVLIHRLDRDTSGVILIAKRKKIARTIHEAFRGQRLTKKYTAICHNRPPKNEALVTLGLSRTHEQRSGTKMEVRKNGKKSQTEYKIVKFTGILSKIELSLYTGKTHQIRVHMAHLGAPIVGDERYGNKKLDDSVFSAPSITRRLYLHAHLVIVQHPVTGKNIRIEAPLPKAFFNVIG